MIYRLKTIPPLVAANFLAQICLGLGYAHNHGILHLDINPSNIFIEAEDRIKILDFGVACPPGADDRSIFDGTIMYMAPEQIECKTVDKRTDIYSLGITAYEMVTGRRPFPEDDIKTIMNTHINQDIPDPITLVPDLPEALRRFIIKACHRDPDQRYLDAGQAYKDILPLSGKLGPGHKVPQSLDPMEILVNEHGLIRQFLDNLAIAMDQIETEERPPREFFEKAIKFARNFTDKFHHFKEEHVMFVRLAQKKGGALDGPIDSLRHQHERGRNFITAISNSLDGYTKGDEIHTTTLLENLAAYIHLLRHHIHKEDHHFYLMVKKEFSESEFHDLLELFNKEDQKGGGRTFENSRKLVQEMAALL
jgi:hemerythrin-like domain-containing protein